MCSDVQGARESRTVAPPRRSPKRACGRTGNSALVLVALRVTAHHAVVHDHVKTRGARSRGRVVIHDAVLEPDRARLDGDRVVNDRSDELRPAKDVDHVDRLRDLPQTRVGALTQHFTDVGVHRDDAIARALQVARDAMAPAAAIRAEADDGNRPGRRQDLVGDIRYLPVHSHPLYRRKSGDPHLEFAPWHPRPGSPPSRPKSWTPSEWWHRRSRPLPAT